jgi:hypothetical protein
LSEKGLAYPLSAGYLGFIERRRDQMFIDAATPREDLEAAILADASLYASLDENKLLNDGYTTEELREAIASWIEAGDECRAV